MVGLIHIVLFDLIESAAGPEVVAKVKRHAGVDTDKPFRIDEAYDDLEWQRLLASTCEVLQLDAAKTEEIYAEHFINDAKRRWPVWFKISKNAREFLERVPAIHNGFATGVRDPEERRKINDKFVLEKNDQELIVHYRSPNKLCGVYTALAKQVFRHYGEDAEISEGLCLKKGDAECEIHVRWQPEPVAATAGASSREQSG